MLSTFHDWFRLNDGMNIIHNSIIGFVPIGPTAIKPPLLSKDTKKKRNCCSGLLLEVGNQGVPDSQICRTEGMAEAK